MKKNTKPGATIGRLYIVCTEVPPNIVGGLGRYLERLTGQGAFQELECHVLGINYPKRGPKQENLGQVRLYRLAKLAIIPVFKAGPHRALELLNYGLTMFRYLVYNLQAFLKILRLDWGRQDSLISIHDWMGCLAGILCRALLKKAVVYHVHSNEISLNTWQSSGLGARGVRWLERTQSSLAHQVVVPSSQMKKQLAAVNWDSRKITVITHGVEDPELRRLQETGPAGRREIVARIRQAYGGAEKLLVFAGRFSDHKGAKTLLKAVKLLGKRPIKLLLIGNECHNSNQNQEISQLIAQLGLGGTVVPFFRFLPACELYEHFLAADACVFPSIYEPFGFVCVEAMALGRPVVLGSGFSPEVAGAGQDVSLQCQADTPEELAALLLRVLDDTAAAEAMGRRAQDYVAERFSWRHTAETTLATYQKALS